MKRRSKLFWLDCETTGTDYKIHDIHELAFLIELDGVVVHEESFKIRPDNFDTIELKALEISGTTVEELEKIDFTIADAVRRLKEVWSIYVDKYDRDDKFIIAGYYIKFDVDFLRSMFTDKVGDRYGIGSYCFSCLLDVSTFVAVAVGKYNFRFKNHKLETVCEKLKIPLEKAHDSMQDIRATRALYNMLGELS